MLPSSLRDALFRMAQRPKVEHENQNFSDKRDRSDYWKERYQGVMKPHVRKANGRKGKKTLQKRSPLKNLSSRWKKLPVERIGCFPKKER